MSLLVRQAKAISIDPETSQLIENVAVTTTKYAKVAPSANYPSIISVMNRLDRPLNGCVVMLTNTAGGIFQ